MPLNNNLWYQMINSPFHECRVDYTIIARDLCISLLFLLLCPQDIWLRSI
jgi:hypothetical protein